MKTKIIIVSLIASTSIFAAQHPEINKDNDFSHWGVKGYIFSMNDQLVQNIKNLKLGYKVQANYNFTKNIYAKASISLLNDGKFGYSGGVGVQQVVGMFRPYVELGYSISYDVNDVKSKSVTYDAGTNIVITPKFVPYVEFDNFVQKGKEAMTVGATYSLKPNLGVGGDFQYVTKTKNNNADVFVQYSF